MLTEVSVLRAEINEMKQAQAKPRAEYASTDDDAYVAAMSMQQTDVDPGEYGGIEWSGFFDVVGNQQSSAEDHTNFGLGQAEIDLASELADNVAVEAAIAYNADDGIFELGAALVDIHLFGTEGSHLRGFNVDHSYIIAGQFDVPFGVDYHVYPSIERKLVTAPAAVDLTHGGWNDFGLQFGLNTTHGNFVLYVVNGFEASAEVIDEAQTLATGVETMEEVETSPANAIGTRLGIAPFEWIEIGTSVAIGSNNSNQNEMSLVGMDLQLNMFNFELKSEIIAHSVNRSVAEENNRGYYAQLTYSFLDRAFVTARNGGFKPEGSDWAGQNSIGFGYSLNDLTQLRFESVINEDSDENTGILQMVVGF